MNFNCRPDLVTRFPYLVQRMYHTETPRSTKSGVDLHFQMDYMGSAEFEFGALPKALVSFRQAKIVQSPLKVQFHGLECWFVGEQSNYPRAVDLFTAHLNKEWVLLKERTRILEAYTGREQRVNAWWAIEENWAIFKTEEAAQSWLRGLRDKPNG